MNLYKNILQNSWHIKYVQLYLHVLIIISQIVQIVKSDSSSDLEAKLTSISELAQNLSSDNFDRDSATLNLIVNDSLPFANFENPHTKKFILNLNISKSEAIKDIVIIVIPDENFMFFNFINEESDYESFTVLKKNEADHHKHKVFWVFKAFLRNTNIDDPHDKIVEIGDKKQVIEWGIWTDQYFPPYAGNDYEEDEFDDYDPLDKHTSVDQDRQKKQEMRWKDLDRLKRKEPTFADKIYPKYEIYTHVRWYGKNYKEATKIELNEFNETTKKFVNHFKGYFYGNCKAKTVNPTKILEAKDAKKIVELYSILLRDYCNPKEVEGYLQLFEKHYLNFNKPHGAHHSSIEIANDTDILKKKELTISEMEEMHRLFIFYGYTQVYQSLITFPTDPVDPTESQITSRVFILLNTILHIEDTILQMAIQHYETVMRNLVQKLKPIMLQIWCEFLTLTRIKDHGRISRQKYDSIAIAMLIESLLKSFKEKPDKPFDAHESLQNLYSAKISNKTVQTYLETYKDKTKELREDHSYRERCYHWMYPNMQK